MFYISQLFFTEKCHHSLIVCQCQLYTNVTKISINNVPVPVVYKCHISHHPLIVCQCQVYTNVTYATFHRLCASAMCIQMSHIPPSIDCVPVPGIYQCHIIYQHPSIVCQCQVYTAVTYATIHRLCASARYIQMSHYIPPSIDCVPVPGVYRCHISHHPSIVCQCQVYTNVTLYAHLTDY